MIKINDQKEMIEDGRGINRMTAKDRVAKGGNIYLVSAVNKMVKVSFPRQVIAAIIAVVTKLHHIAGGGS